MVPTPRGPCASPEDELQRGCPGRFHDGRGCWSPQPSPRAQDLPLRGCRLDGQAGTGLDMRAQICPDSARVRAAAVSSSVTTSNNQPAVDPKTSHSTAPPIRRRWIPPRRCARSRCRPVTRCDEGILVLDREPFPLHFGGELPRVEIAYRIAGADGAPVVVVLGGISAGRNVFKVRDGVPGWWDEIAGPGKALDTDRFRVLGIDFLGGSHRTTGPGHGEVFPSVSAHDQAACLRGRDGPPRHREPARLHRRVLRRHGHAGDGRDAPGAPAARHRRQRGAPHASDVDGVAQRAAQFRALRHRARRGRAGPRAGARAGHDDLPFRARIRGSLPGRADAPRRAVRVPGRGVHRLARRGLCEDLPARGVRLPVGVDRPAPHRTRDDRRADDHGRRAGGPAGAARRHAHAARPLRQRLPADRDQLDVRPRRLLQGSRPCCATFSTAHSNRPAHTTDPKRIP